MERITCMNIKQKILYFSKVLILVVVAYANTTADIAIYHKNLN